MAGLQLEYTVCLASGACHDVSVSETCEKQRQPQANGKQSKSVKGKGVYFASWVERCSNPTREQKAAYRHSGEQSRESEVIFFFFFIKSVLAFWFHYCFPEMGSLYSFVPRSSSSDRAYPGSVGEYAEIVCTFPMWGQSLKPGHVDWQYLGMESIPRQS